MRTARARHKIKQWVNHEEETVSLALGKDILTREVKRRRLEPPDDDRLAKAAATLSLADGRGLEIAVGRGDVAIGQVIRALYPELAGDELQEPKPTVFGRVIDRIRLRPRHQDPGRRRAHGPLRAVLPAGARAIRSWAT